MNLDKELTRLVNKIVHLRDSNKKCIICGNPMFYYQAVDACHYVKSSQSKYLKWSLNNVNLGHRECNINEENQKQLRLSHSSNMFDKYGEFIVMELHRDKNKESHFSKSDKEKMIKELKATLKTYEA